MEHIIVWKKTNFRSTRVKPFDQKKHSAWQVKPFGRSPAARQYGDRMMKKSITGGAIVAASVLSACAQQPNNIVAAEVSRGAYAGASCRSLQTELFSVETKLGELSAAQTSAANADAAWVAGGALLFLPAMAVAAAGPDYAGEIATLKGQRNALREQMVSSGC